MNFKDPKSEAANANRHQSNVDGVICDDHNPVQLNSGPNIVQAKERSPKPMRFLERLFILCLFSLTLGVFCSEVPELFSLYDDPSDDFVTCSSLPTVGNLQIVSHHRTPQSAFAPIAAVAGLPVIYPPETPFLAGVDLLLLFFIQRK